MARRERCVVRKANFWKASEMLVVWAAMAIAAQAQSFDSFYNFEWPSGANPYYMTLVQGIDGSLYGTTQDGGSGTGFGKCTSGLNVDCGTVFKIDRTGTFVSLYSFCLQQGCPDGYYPYSGLAVGPGGDLYGTTFWGGANGMGTIFKMTSARTLITLHSFNGGDGDTPTSGVIFGRDGNLYGMTNGGGTQNAGTVYRITPAGTLTTLYNFCALTDCKDGESPWGGLVQGSDGNFYGTTVVGGDPACFEGASCGTVFKITPGGRLTTLHKFVLTDGEYPYASLVQGVDGNFYGTTSLGGTSGSGTVFQMTPDGVVTTIHSFCSQANCPDGREPQAPLIQATDGKFYGTATQGGEAGCIQVGCGTLFQITKDGTFTVLHIFDFGDGYIPDGGMLQATDGRFYGTTQGGGSALSGTIFRLSTDLPPFVTFVRNSGYIGQTGPILGQGFTGTTSVSFNGMSAQFTVKSDTYLLATVPPGATTGYVTVTTPSGTLTSNKPFVVIP